MAIWIAAIYEVSGELAAASPPGVQARSARKSLERKHFAPLRSVCRADSLGGYLIWLEVTWSISRLGHGWQRCGSRAGELDRLGGGRRFWVPRTRRTDVSGIGSPL